MIIDQSTPQLARSDDESDQAETPWCQLILFDQKIAIDIPCHFHDMSPLMVSLKYPSEDKPDVIKTSKEDVDLTFSFIAEPVTDADVENAKAQLKGSIKQLYPSSVLIDDVIQPHNQTLLGYFSFKNYAMSNERYYLMMITKIDDQLFLATFNCSYDTRERWDKIFWKMIISIQDLALKGSAQL